MPSSGRLDRGVLRPNGGGMIFRRPFALRHRWRTWVTAREALESLVAGPGRGRCRAARALAAAPFVEDRAAKAAERETSG
jgi:hypothetical protein